MGQFRELVESCTKDAPLQEALKKALNFTAKGWEAARAHAVSTDNRMRVWASDDSHKTGALFRCHLGRVDLDAPVGAALVLAVGYLRVALWAGEGTACGFRAAGARSPEQSDVDPHAKHAAKRSPWPSFYFPCDR